MNKKQTSIFLVLILYVVIGLVAACLLFFMGTGRRHQSAFSPASIEAAEKKYIVEEKVEEVPVIVEEKEKVSYFKVTTTNRFSPLNVRIAPGLFSEIIGKLNPRSEAYVLEKGEEWSKIKTDTVEGYCSNQYLDFQEISKEDFPY